MTVTGWLFVQSEYLDTTLLICCTCVSVISRFLRGICDKLDGTCPFSHKTTKGKVCLHAFTSSNRKDLKFCQLTRGGGTGLTFSIKVTVNNIPILKTLCDKDLARDLSPKLMVLSFKKSQLAPLKTFMEADQIIGLLINSNID